MEVQAKSKAARKSGVASALPIPGDSCSCRIDIQNEGEIHPKARGHASQIIEQDDTSRNKIINIQVEAAQNELVKQMESRIQNPKPRLPGTIYRVPKIVRETGHDAYKPRVLSIGPYHHIYHRNHHHQTSEKDKLQEMEEHKWRYLSDFLRRKASNSLENIVNSIRTLEEQARTCYYEEIVMSSDKFVQILVLDSCFLIELFLKHDLELFTRDDPLYSISWVMVRIAYDLLVMENQIPFFILQHIFDHHVNQKVPSLQTLAMNFFRKNVRMYREILQDKLADNPSEGIHHLLHLFYLNVRQPITNTNHSSLSYKLNIVKKAIKSKFRATQREVIIADEIQPTAQKYLRHLRPFPNVVSLREAGIYLRRGRGIGLLDISFKNGVLKIPHFCIEDSTNGFIRNLTALEQCHPELGNHFTIYTIFMNFIIDTADDVTILRRKGIIEHTLGSDEKAAELFNWASNGTAIRNHDKNLTDVCEQVNKYCNKRVRIWRAKLKRDYFNNPWACLSVLQALMLLGLTVVQATFSVLQSIFSY